MDEIDVDALVDIVLIDIGRLMVGLCDLKVVVPILSHLGRYHRRVISVFKRLVSG